MSRILRILMVVAAAVGSGLLVSSDSALAQCAMCRAGISQVFARNLNLAILVLFVPPVSMFAAIFFVAFRKRKG